MHSKCTPVGRYPILGMKPCLRTPSKMHPAVQQDKPAHAGPKPRGEDSPGHK